MQKLKLQYSGYLMRRPNSLEKTLMRGKTEDKRSMGQQRLKLLESITNSMDVTLSKLWELVHRSLPGSMGSQKVGHELVTVQQQLGKISFSDSSICWQNSVPHSCMTEICILLMVIHWGQFPVSRSQSIIWFVTPFLCCWNQQWQVKSLSCHIHLTHLKKK